MKNQDSYCKLYTEECGGVMSREAMVKSIVTFLIIIFGEASDALLKRIYEFSPEYLIEKYERYMRLDADEFLALGLHKNFETQLFDAYCTKWALLENDHLDE